ncbi:MAG: CoA-binding domain [Candidatus Saccharicenans subterraneus]|uniref:CoA-binding domain n=1 Tax=Candidatus Saccharicenans subterraneus TaxID=2508984 RepID=A0A3E2BP92_9BACT|nr:MAG: CoA-binding domain [Candidatus Saccharicenans subterraneum]
MNGARNKINEFLNEKEIAVVGASRNPAKYGNIVFKKLKSAGYLVYPVNPRADLVDGQRAYPDLASLPETVRAAVVVVPPEISEKIAAQAVAAGFRYIWFQPGAESETAISLLEAAGISVIHGTCLLVRVSP